MWTKKLHRDPFGLLLIGTIVAALVATTLLYGAGLFRHRGYFPSLDQLDHIGSFLSGVFTPIAVGWAALGFFIQRQQMELSMAGLEKQLMLQQAAHQHAIHQLEIEAKERDEQAKLRFIEGLPVPSASSGMSLSGRYKDGHTRISDFQILIYISVAPTTRLDGCLIVNDQKMGTPVGSFPFSKESPIKVTESHKEHFTVERMRYTSDSELYLVLQTTSIGGTRSLRVFKGDRGGKFHESFKDIEFDKDFQAYVQDYITGISIR